MEKVSDSNAKTENNENNHQSKRRKKNENNHQGIQFFLRVSS